MTITISNSEFLQYHNNVYKNEDNKNNIRASIESKGSSFRVKNVHENVTGRSTETSMSTEIYKGPQGIELSNLVIDVDTLERNMACDDDEIEDENVRAYIESQKSHKLRFLQEVQERGLRTRHDNDNYNDNNNDKVAHLNY